MSLAALNLARPVVRIGDPDLAAVPQPTCRRRELHAGDSGVSLTLYASPLAAFAAADPLPPH